MYFSKGQKYSDEFRLNNKQECMDCESDSIEAEHGLCRNCGCVNIPFIEDDKEYAIDLHMDEFIKSFSAKLHTVEEIFQLILKNFDEIIYKKRGK